jgi:hypothetical protein
VMLIAVIYLFRCNRVNYMNGKVNKDVIEWGIVLYLF